MTLQYKLFEDEAGSNLSLILNGTVHPIGADHPYFTELVDAARSNDESLAQQLVNIAEAVANTFHTVTERITLKGETVYFDGDAIDNSLTQAITRARGSNDFESLARFMEKVYTNPNAHSRSQLFDWLKDRDFSITNQGNIVAYKGVTDALKSSRSGPGIVNGVAVNGHLDNSVGNVVEMARSQVNHNPSQGCSTGLHVAEWEYASHWDSKTVKVEVNPRDVVSVPTDTHAQKMRVCRYRVIEVVDQPVGSVVDEEVNDWAEDWRY